MTNHKILPFRTQRALAAFAVAALLILFSVAVIWSHVDGISSFSPGYRLLAKAGLACVELVSVILLAWEIWAKDKVLSMACFAAEFVLVIVMLVHAGAVLQLDSSGSRQEKTIGAVADAQAKIAAARESARIKAAGESAAELNRRGQRRTAAAIARSASTDGSASDNALLGSIVEQTAPTTFLPDAYMTGGLYYWPPLIAFVLFMAVLLISKSAIALEDSDGNGVPDILEPWRHSAKRPAGFASAAGNYSFHTSGQAVPKAPARREPGDKE